MKPTIEYKMDFDFIAFNQVCANIKEEKKKSLAELKQHPAINTKEFKKSHNDYFNAIEEYYNEHLSYIQRNELDMFFGKVSIYSDYLLKLAFKEIDLESETLEDFKCFIKHMLELEDEDLESGKIIKALKEHYDSPNCYSDHKKTAELILETLKDERMFNSIFKNAVHSLRDLFTEKKYMPEKADLDKKIAEHNALYQKDPKAFVMKLGNGLIKEDDLKEDMQLYVTFYTRYRLMLSVKQAKQFIIYNYVLKDMNQEEMEKDLIQSFLKFLSDPKRYEMIQMLSKETWYANELAKKFKITPATMSYHVNKLFALGLISFEQGEQNKLYIELDKERLRYLLDKISNELLK